MSWSFAVGGSAAPEIPDDEGDGSEASRRIGRLPHGSRHRKLEMPRRVQSWVCELVRLLGSVGKTWPSPRLRLEMRVNRWRHRVRHSRQCWTVLGPTFLGGLRSREAAVWGSRREGHRPRSVRRSRWSVSESSRRRLALAVSSSDDTRLGLLHNGESGREQLRPCAQLGCASLTCFMPCCISLCWSRCQADHLDVTGNVLRAVGDHARLGQLVPLTRSAEIFLLGSKMVGCRRSSRDLCRSGRAHSL